MMTDYTKLVEALLWCEFGWSARTCDNCEYSKTDCQLLLSDAAAAIEELQADIKACRTLSKCRLQGWKESELFCEEQAKTLESVDVLNKSYLERIRKLEQQLPNRGKWVEETTTYAGPGLSNYKCLLCGKICGTWRRGLNHDELPNFCGNCGADMRAKMEVQE